MKKKILLLFFAAFLLLEGCARNESEKYIDLPQNATANNAVIAEYATQFSIDYTDKGYTHIHVEDGSDYILLPQDVYHENDPMDNTVYITRGTDKIYLAASSVMDLFVALNATDNVVATSTKAGDFSQPFVSEKIENNEITYVGKYSSPDYESLLNIGCELAIESTMIGHAPKIQEKLESLSIPVFVDRSSYEESPLGRLEWIKVYGAILGKEEEASNFFSQKVKELKHMSKNLEAESDDIRPKVAFFYISSNGYINVRKPGDYICKMLEMAGGEYALSSIMAESNALSTMNINWEDFYTLARDADIIIYNGTIDGGIDSIEDLIGKNALFADFKAVKDNRVYTTGLNMYQESSKIVDIILEMNRVIKTNNIEENRYILPLSEE